MAAIMKAIAALPKAASVVPAQGQRDEYHQARAVHRRSPAGSFQDPRSEAAVPPNHSPGLQKWIVK